MLYRPNGKLLLFFLTFPHFNSSYVRLQPSWPFSSSSSTLTLDVASIPSKSKFMWSRQLAPVLIAAQYGGKDEQLAVEQLAQAFHSTIILLILYYLDTNTTERRPIPEWMILFGVIYHEGGIMIQEFFPTLNIETGSTTGKSSWSWGASSSSTVRFDSALVEHPIVRSTLVATLLRIQNRASHLLGKLATWKGFRQIVSKYI
jgi:hypothetical protein